VRQARQTLWSFIVRCFQLIADYSSAQKEYEIMKEGTVSGNTAMAQLLSDCQDVICHSVFLDDKAHLTLMDRINVAV